LVEEALSKKPVSAGVAIVRKLSSALLNSGSRATMQQRFAPSPAGVSEFMGP
jgi:hypothetical protein